MKSATGRDTKDPILQQGLWQRSHCNSHLRGNCSYQRSCDCRASGQQKKSSIFTPISIPLIEPSPFSSGNWYRSVFPTTPDPSLAEVITVAIPCLQASGTWCSIALMRTGFFLLIATAMQAVLVDLSLVAPVQTYLFGCQSAVHFAVSRGLVFRSVFI